MTVDRDNNLDIGTGIGLSKTKDADASVFIDVDEVTGEMVLEDEQESKHTLREIFYYREILQRDFFVPGQYSMLAIDCLEIPVDKTMEIDGTLCII